MEPINFYYSISEMNREITEISDTLNQILGDEKTSSELFVLNLPNFAISSKWSETQLANLTEKHSRFKFLLKSGLRKIDVSNLKSYSVHENEVDRADWNQHLFEHCWGEKGGYRREWETLLVHYGWLLIMSRLCCISTRNKWKFGPMFRPKNR
jgi:hypothetical protein